MAPRTFNEKVNWRKLYQRLDLHVEAADKLRSKVLAKRLAPSLSVPEVLWEGASFVGLDPSALPGRSVIKATTVVR